MTRILTITEAHVLFKKIEDMKSIFFPITQTIPGLLASRDEGAAYSSKQDSDVIGVRIKNMEQELKSAKIIFPEKQSEKVKMGNKILASVDGNQSSEFVMSDLVERNDGRTVISSSSPIGKTILGKGIGIYEIPLPRKQMVMQIHKIFPPED